MTERDALRDEAVAALSGSLVGLCYAAWLPLLIAWLLLLRSPASPAPTYERIRIALLVGGGIATALTLAGGIWIHRLPEAGKARLAGRVARGFGNHRRALLLCLLLIEFNILAQLILPDIAPSITGPFRFLLLCWSVALIGLALMAQWPAARHAFQRGRNLLALLGFTLSTALLIFLLAALSSRLIESSGIQGRLRGALDYRPLEFIDDGAAPSAREFWAEQSAMRVRWLPYSYWTVAPFAGRFINVDEAGRRHTPAQAIDPASPRLYFFGGSAVWGEGARDAYTIPAQVARLLARRGSPAQVENYAQTGYVSWQDLLLFQAQLALGNAPELAVFYQGFNDVYAAYLQGAAGLTLRENQRVSDVELGRLVRRGQPVLRPFEADISDYDWRLVTSGSASADDIAERWLENRRLTRAVAAEHGVRVLFVWQPALFAKAKPTISEARILADIERDQSGFVDLYRAAVGIARDGISREGAGDTVFLTDLFGDERESRFFDRVHVNELGNRQIAESLAPAIEAALDGA